MVSFPTRVSVGQGLSLDPVSFVFICFLEVADRQCKVPVNCIMGASFIAVKVPNHLGEKAVFLYVPTGFPLPRPQKKDFMMMSWEAAEPHGTTHLR